METIQLSSQLHLVEMLASKATMLTISTSHLSLIDQMSSRILIVVDLISNIKNGEMS